MKILHLSDIHCTYRRVEELLREVKLDSYDLVVVSGDIECPDLVMEPLINSGVTIYAVPGNMDDIYVKDYLESKGINVDGKLVEHRGYVLAGIGGIHPQTSLERVVNQLKASPPGGKLLVLTHHPPFRTKVDKALRAVHAGLREIREFVEKWRPLVLMCGHIHESRGVDKLGETVVVNPGPLARGYFAEIDLPSLNVKLRSLS